MGGVLTQVAVLAVPPRAADTRPGRHVARRPVAAVARLGAVGPVLARGTRVLAADARPAETTATRARHHVTDAVTAALALRAAVDAKPARRTCCRKDSNGRVYI